MGKSRESPGQPSVTQRKEDGCLSSYVSGALTAEHGWQTVKNLTGFEAEGGRPYFPLYFSPLEGRLAANTKHAAPLTVGIDTGAVFWHIKGPP